jgi:hypothetical protein
MERSRFFKIVGSIILAFVLIVGAHQWGYARGFEIGLKMGKMNCENEYQTKAAIQALERIEKKLQKRQQERQKQ